jgi:hypothetical protein
VTVLKLLRILAGSSLALAAMYLWWTGEALPTSLGSAVRWILIALLAGFGIALMRYKHAVD